MNETLDANISPSGSDDELDRIRKSKMEEMLKAKKQETNSLDSPIEVEDSTFSEITEKYTLMVLDCWAPWCSPCRAVAPIIDKLAKEYAGKVVFGKLNVDENPETSTRFGIMGIPTLLILKNGQEVDRVVGVIPKQYIEARLLKHL